MAKQPKTAKNPKPSRPAKAADETAPRAAKSNGATPKMSSKCTLKLEPPRIFGPKVNAARMNAIIDSDKKWVTGTRLRYYFFDRPTDGEYVKLRDGTAKFIPWNGAARDKRVVRRAFQTWKDLGIGLSFLEVDNREDAEVRIGFMRGDGHWSYLGRDILAHGANHRTMNFDGALGGTEGFDTALHEIGHTLSMPHEHQNPISGIVWDEAEVIRRLAEPPNEWDADTTRYNILRKIPASTVRGTDWDRDSIMHYEFGAGMIKIPKIYQTKDLVPAPGLSAMDKAWVLATYPATTPADSLPQLQRFVSHPLDLRAGEQFDGVFIPDATGRYSVQSFGSTDMVLTIFEGTPDGPQFLEGQDDSGEDTNAALTIRLIKGRTYIVRARMFYNWSGSESAIMIH